MLEILERITEGKGELEDLDKLETLAKTIQKTSVCGLGQTAPNPILSTMKYFRDEYVAHVQDETCPAGECKALTKLSIDQEKCKRCGLCAKKCPVGALKEKDDTKLVWRKIYDKDIFVVVQTAPAVRAALGEEFGMPIGTNVEGKMVTALKMLGFDKVFDTDTAADLTIMEEATGAGAIFGTTGGVMEAALRTSYEIITGNELKDVEFESVRGKKGIKKAVVKIGDTDVKVAVAHGLSNARKIMKEIKNGEADYQFVDIWGLSPFVYI